ERLALLNEYIDSWTMDSDDEEMKAEIMAKKGAKEEDWMEEWLQERPDLEKALHEDLVDVEGYWSEEEIGEEVRDHEAGGE
ncbi:MAG: hypothetical protein Q9195_009482, partial [Heterodermia aff. obscurata]